ncbi:RICIN domain-containing protein [Streptomyces sp. NPDC086033]|uniref:RICIN domain-containing protein n=1 Tax=Streptomyces sp. NPDC086033 TaxID=3365747 RepID=UPI0037D0CDFC
MSRARALRDLRAAPLALLAFLAGSLPTAGAAFAVPSERQASAAELYVAPGAPAGGNGTVEQPFATIDQAQQPAHRLSADADVVVRLAGGTYRLSKPLTFGSGDGGQNRHTITYQAMPGQQPVVSGAQQISGWQVHDQSSNIWSVHVGSGDYANRGTYNYQPVYSAPTTLKNNTVSHNLVFDTKNAMFDGGSIYSLSAAPGSVISDNYMYDNNRTTALYLDEGSRYLKVSGNVVQDAGNWALTNANASNHTDDSMFSGNWYNGGNTYVATGPPHNNVLSGNVLVSGTNWPQGARAVIQQAGVQTSGDGGFPTGYHQLVISSNSLCLEVYGNSTSAGAAIDQWTCNGQSNQQFEFVPVSGGYGQLRAQNFGQVVAVSGGSRTAGTPNIEQQAADGAAGALWLPVQQSDGSYSFKNQNSQLCLDVYGGSSDPGRQLDQWPCKNAPGTNQDFPPPLTHSCLRNTHTIRQFGPPTHCPAPSEERS